MKELIKKYMIEGDAITAWLIMKAPFLVALIYLIKYLRGDLQVLLITLFFFPYVFLLIRNIFLEIVFMELLSKIKREETSENKVVKKLFRFTRIGIAIMAVGMVFLFPVAIELNIKPDWKVFPVIIVSSVFLLLTLSVFLFQVRFRFEIGMLIYQLDTRKIFDRKKELDDKYRLKLLNPVAFRKSHDRIKRAVK